MLVVPLPSDRCTGRIGTPGSATPGLAAAIALSFHIVIVPMKMPVIASGVSCTCALKPGRL